MNIVVRDRIGENAVTRKAGQLLYDDIHDALVSGESVVLDFKDVQAYEPAFLTGAIGQLYRDLSAQEVSERLTIHHMTATGLEMLDGVIATVKQRYSNTFKDYAAWQMDE